MPTILSDRAFQVHYRKLGKQLKKNPDALTINQVIADIREQVVRAPSSERKMPAWRWKKEELKGEEIFTRFTSLFFEKHKVSANEAQEIRAIFESAGNSVYMNALKKELDTQLTVSEKLEGKLDNPTLKDMGKLLNQRIEFLQNKTKPQMKSKEKFSKLENISKMIRKGMMGVGFGVAIGSVIGGFSGVLLPIVAIPFFAGMALGILAIIPLGIELFCGLKRKRAEKVINRNTQEIQKMMDFCNKMKDADVIRFLEALRASDSSILSKEGNLKSIVDLYENEEKVGELKDTIKELENVLSDFSEPVKQESLGGLRAALQRHATKAQALRTQLHLPASESL